MVSTIKLSNKGDAAALTVGGVKLAYKKLLSSSCKIVNIPRRKRIENIIHKILIIMNFDFVFV